MDDAAKLQALHEKKDLTLDDLNIFADSANEQSAILTKWVSSFNSFDLELVDTSSQQKDLINLARFYDRLEAQVRSGRTTEAIEMARHAINVLHFYLDNFLRPNLREVVRVNDARAMASARMIESLMTQRTQAQQEAAGLKEQADNQAVIIKRYQEENERLRDKLEILEFYIDMKAKGSSLKPEQAEALCEIERHFVVDKMQAAAQPQQADINSEEEFITKESQQRKKKQGVGLLKQAFE